MHKLRKLIQVSVLLIRKIYAKIEAIKSEQANNSFNSMEFSIEWQRLNWQ